MPAVSLDQVLRSLEPNSEVSFSLADFPLDEVLLVLHETRFSGETQIGLPPEVDRLEFRDGKLIALTPNRFQHVALMVSILVEMRATGGDALRAVVEEDATMDGALFGKKLINRSMVDRETWERASFEAARRRLFQLYDLVGAQTVIYRSDSVERSDATAIDVLPAIAYGIVVRAVPARRQAMLAFAAHKVVRLLAAYDLDRNRCGLPPALLEAVKHLMGEGVTFGSVPNLPGLTPDTTAGILLLFQRMSLLAFGKPSEKVPSSDSPAP
jgi:hypothetical protein